MKTYGLVGQSLKHSFSKTFFTALFEREKTKAEYLNFELSDISEIKGLVKSRNIQGFNVTIPYKSTIIPYLTSLSAEAEKIGAVNTVIVKSGEMFGFNTDAFGFSQSIKPFLTFQHERAILLGTGGASKAVAYVLKNLGIEVLFISRNPIAENEFGYSEMNDHMLKACKLIVNCTPIGTYPNCDECIDFPYQFLTPDHLAIDLIYNPEKTKFLQNAEKQGAMVLNGKSMLEHQALKAWELWNLEK